MHVPLPETQSSLGLANTAPVPHPLRLQHLPPKLHVSPTLRPSLDTRASASTRSDPYEGREFEGDWERTVSKGGAC